MSRVWERQNGEGEEAHAAFLAYRDAGPRRTIAASRLEVGKESVGYARVMERWSSDHDWVERCRAWDNHLQAIRDEEAAKDAALWERRRLEEIERVWDLSQTYGRLVKLGLKFPMERRTTTSEPDEKGNRTITIIEPSRWTMRDLVAMGQASAQLAAACLAAVDKDPSAMSDAELEAVMNVGLDRAAGAPK